MKRIILLGLMTLAISVGIVSAEDIMYISDFKNSYFQQEELNITIDNKDFDIGDNLVLLLRSTDEDYEEIIIEKNILGPTLLQVGEIIDYPIDTYRFVLEVNEKEVARTDKFKVQENDIIDINIDKLHVSVNPLQYSRQVPGRTHTLEIATDPDIKFRDLNTKTYIQCAHEVTLKSKLSNVVCNESYQLIQNDWSGNQLNIQFGLNKEDATSTNKFTVKHELYNKNSVLLDEKVVVYEINQIKNKLPNDNQISSLLVKLETMLGKDHELVRRFQLFVKSL